MHLAGASGGASCSVYLYGHPTVITFSSPTLQVRRECADWIRGAARSDELWTPTPQQSPNGAYTQVCALEDAQHNVRAMIAADTGGGVYGQAACTGLITQGWTEAS